MKYQRGDRDKRRKRDSTAKRQALISAATGLFARKGYATTTTSEIAARAGCSEGLIHRYFGAKSGLLLAILEALESREDRSLLERGPSRDSAGEEMQRLVQAQLDHLWEEREYLVIGFSQALLDRKFGGALGLIARKREKLIATELRDHQEAGQFADNDIKTMAQAITALSFLFGFVHPVILGHDRSRARKQILDIAELMFRAVHVQRPPALP